MPLTLSVTFWGTRGTIPVPGHGTERYGGNTSCVSIRDSEGHCVILDAGTGIRELGHSLRGAAAIPRIDLMLSHVHWDHIQGLPFFSPMYSGGQEIHIWGPAPIGIGLAALLERQLEAAVYPVPRAARPATVAIQEIAAGSAVETPGLHIQSFGLSHPGGALGYRATPRSGGPSVAYLTDNELGPGGAGRVPSGWHAELTRFVSGATVLIHDGMYTPALGVERSGWGHSSALEAVRLAEDAGVKHLVLFHHDPDHDDSQVDGLLAVAQGAAPAGLTVSAAREGSTVTL
jgi:phosphoribosyl 1,2-cyclic phosphodiesterase